jgi:hypothetical protein
MVSVTSSPLVDTTAVPASPKQLKPVAADVEPDTAEAVDTVNDLAGGKQASPLDHASADHETEVLPQRANGKRARDAAEEADGDDAPSPDLTASNESSEAAISSADAAAKDSQQQQVVEEPWRKRMWFVRLPKPVDESQAAVASLEQEIESYKAQVQLLNESINVNKIARDSSREGVAAARAEFNRAKAAESAKLEEMEPLRAARDEAKSMRDAKINKQSSFSAAYKDLMARSEEELDAKVAQLEYRLHHDSMPLSEEKKTVQEIRRLKSQRERVRAYEAQQRGFEAEREASRQAAQDAPQQPTSTSLRELEGERKVLNEEKRTRLEILQKYQDEASTLDQEVEKAMDERRRIKGIQDDAYARLRAVKGGNRSKLDEFYANRRFSQQVRGVIRAGNLEEAQTMCEQQSLETMQRLASDDAFRKEYFTAWEHMRPPTFSVGQPDVPEDFVLPAGTDIKPKKGGKKAAAAPAPQQQAAQQMPAKSRAELIIAAALNEAKQELARSKNGTGANADDLALPSSLGSSTPASDTASASGEPAKPKQAKPAVAPVQDAINEVEAKPKQPSKKKDNVPPPLPEGLEQISQAKAPKVVDPEVVRAQQRDLQQEALRRKQRQAERQAKAIERRKAKEAEAKADADAKSAAAKAAEVPVQAPAFTESSEEAGAETAAATESAVTAVKEGAAIVADKVTTAVKTAKTKAERQNAALQRRLRQPAARGKNTIKARKADSWQAWLAWVQENPIYGAVAALTLIIVILAAMWPRSKRA